MNTHKKLIARMTLLCLLSPTLAHAMEGDRQKETDEDKGQEQSNKRAKTEATNTAPAVDAAQQQVNNQPETEQARVLRELRQLSAGNEELIQAVSRLQEVLEREAAHPQAGTLGALSPAALKPAALSSPSSARRQPEALVVPAQVLSAQGLFEYAENLYLGRNGVARNPQEARRLYESLLQRDDAQEQKAYAWIRLGEIYQEGTLVIANIDRARSYYDLAKNQEINKRAKAQAYVRLAELLKPETAALIQQKRELLSYVIGQNDDLHTKNQAIALLAHLTYETNPSEGGPGGHVRVRQLCDLCLQQNINPWAQAKAKALLAELAYFGDRANRQDYRAAYNLYRQLIDQTDNLQARAQAWVRLGEMLYLGFGMPRNRVQALVYFNLAAQQNDDLLAKANAERHLKMHAENQRLNQ